ncbi:hypothetical protein [Parasitella parasitica]|uniref:Histone acetyltransferase n=1 Tax=Parasitella parasitica TaxID=35722 RepID=A0A0B7MXA6_9FUNG|nr:hypothetical protein [Parasitella parasitica]
MTETDQHGCHFVGYFSKEKRSVMNFNVSCILIMPTYQRKGYGQYLIDFSYLLTRHEHKIGTPEKPLSALGLLGYQRYWDYTILKHFGLKMDEKHESINDISMKTGMTPDDIIATLQRNNMLIFSNGQYVLHINKRDIKLKMAKFDSKNNLKIDSKNLIWTPPTDTTHLDSI